MSEVHRFPMDDARPLRYEKCGEQIGVVLSDEAGRPEDNPNIELLCYGCAAVGEAESLLDSDTQSREEGR